MRQPSWLSSMPLSASPRNSAGRPGLARACTQSESPASGSRQPSACSVRLSASAARYSWLSPVTSRKRSRSRLILAIPWPRAEVMSSSSESSECRQKILPDAASFPWRSATRPESSKPPGRGRTASGKDAQAPRTAAAATQSARRSTAKSAPEALDRIGERFVVRAFPGGIAPDALRLGALAHRPEHFAQVSGDFRVGTPGERAAQVAERILQLAHPVQHPSHAVDDERILGGKLQRLFDQHARLGQALIAVGEGIAERIVGVRMLGPYLDQLAKGGLENIHAFYFLREHGVVVEELGIVRNPVERPLDQIERGLRLVGIAQELRFGEDQLHALLAVLRRRLLQARARFVELALSGEHLGVADLRLYILLALAHFTIPAERLRKILPLLGDLTEIQAHAVLVAVGAFDQAPEILLRSVVVLELKGKQRHRERRVAALGNAGHELLELGARLAEVFLRHQQARVGEARFPRRGVFFQMGGKQRRGLIHRGLLQQLRFEKDRRLPVRPQLSGLAGFLERKAFVPRVDCRPRDGKMRLGELGIVCGETVHELQSGLLVLGTGKRAGQLR